MHSLYQERCSAGRGSLREMSGLLHGQVHAQEQRNRQEAVAKEGKC